MFLTILQPFRCVFRSEREFEIEIETRSAGKNIRLALPALDRSRGHGAGESESHRFGVHSPLPLGQRTTAWPQLRCIWLRLPASC